MGATEPPLLRPPEYLHTCYSTHNESVFYIVYSVYMRIRVINTKSTSILVKDRNNILPLVTNGEVIQIYENSYMEVTNCDILIML